jgi:hypothetical protein
VKVGDAYKLKIESILEQPRLSAVRARDGASLRISWTDVKVFGINRMEKREQGRVVTEFELLNLSKPGESAKQYFTSHKSKSSFQLLVGKRSAREGDSFRLVEARKYGISDFVKDFNSHKSAKMKNVELNIQENRLSMQVDGQNFAFEHWCVSALGGEVLLSGKLEHVDSEIRFWFDGEKMTCRFDGYTRLNWIKATKYGIEFSYSPNNQRELRHRQSLGEFDGTLVINDVALVSRPENRASPYTFGVPRSVQEYVQFRLGATGKFRGYMFEKGRISEEMQRQLVSLTGEWDEVANHPERYGPDSVQRSRASKELYYFEFKWEQSKPIESTRADATAQVIRDCEGRPHHNNEPVAGGYIGLLDWDGSEIGHFYLERVWPKDEKERE